MSEWLARVGTFVRGAWLFAGLVLVCVYALNELLVSALPRLPKRLKVDPEVSEASIKHAEAYRGQDWSREYQRESRRSRVMVWEPYVYWRRPAFAGDYVNVDEYGRRSTWTAEGLRRRSGRVRIRRFDGLGQRCA